MELSSEYCFPAQRQHPTAPASSDCRQRASSFNDASARPSRLRHAHRRSAAVSEDLSGVDFSALVNQRGTMSSVFDRSPSRSPTLHSADSDSSAVSGYPSGMDTGSPGMRGKGPRVSFVDNAKPSDSMYRIGAPLQLEPPILMSPPACFPPEPASPCDSLPDSPVKHRRRLSFTKMFGKKKRESSASLNPPGYPINYGAGLVAATPPEQFGFQASPALSSPRHSFEEPEPPRIDLNEALGWRVSASYIKPESPLGHESPFVKKRLSFIDTVAEVENEEEDGRADLTGDVTITGSNYDRESSPLPCDLEPVHTPRFDSIRAVNRLAIMDPIESPSILVAKNSEESFSCYGSSSSSHQTINHAVEKPRRSRHHRRRRSLAAIFGRTSTPN